MEETRRDFLKTVGKAAAVAGAAMAGGLPDEASAANTSAKFWKEVAKSFTINKDLHYHNIGGTGSMPKHVLKNFDTYNRTVAADPNASYSITQMRADIAPSFGANADEIVLTTNTTDGMCMSLNGLDWNAGDEILSTNMEHPGGNGPMAHVAARKGVTIVRAELPVGSDVEPQDFIDAFAARLTSRTKAICFSHIPYLTGALLPAKALCAWARDRNLVSIIDGAHVTGMMDIDFHDMGVDLYAGSGHKWQCGPRGTGIWYVRNGFYPSNSQPLPMLWGVLVSGTTNITSRFNPGTTTPKNIGSFLQSHGHSNEPEWQALTDSCKYWDQIGRERIEDYLTGANGLSTELKRRVVQTWGRQSLMNSDHTDLISGITTINPFHNKSDTTKMGLLVNRLASEYNITTALRNFPVPAAQGGGSLTSVRVSTHLFHDFKDLDYLMDAIMALTPQIDV